MKPGRLLKSRYYLCFHTIYKKSIVQIILISKKSGSKIIYLSLTGRSVKKYWLSKF
jgi:hypothetical protein